MGKFLRKHQEWVLVFFALVFLGLLAGYFAWGLTVLGTNLTKAFSIPQINEESLQFDFEGFKALDLKS